MEGRKIMTTLIVIHKSFPDQSIQSTGNSGSQLVPRIGDRVDMGFLPVPTVTDVVWKFSAGQDLTITVVVD